MRKVAVILASASLILACATLGILLFGPTYGTATSSIGVNGTATSTRGTTSLVEVGVSGVTLFYLGIIALGFVAVFLGALLEYRRDAAGRRLMLMGLVPPVALSLVSFSLGALWPATGLAAAATAAAFAIGRPPEETPAARPSSGPTIWLVGALPGALVTPVILIVGVPAAILAVLLIGIGSIPSRNLAVPSGAFTAAGIVYLLLLANADRACREFDRGPNQGCTTPDSTAFVAQAVVLILVGVVLGVADVVRRRA